MQGIALWNMSTLDTQMSFHDAAVARMIQSVALPFLFVPITNIAYVGIKPDENNQASALMNVSRNLGGTFGISLVQTMLARQSQVHQAQYVEEPQSAQSQLRHRYRSTSPSADGARSCPRPMPPRAANAELYRSLGQQAQMLSYIDVFHVLMWMVFAGVAAGAVAARSRKDQGGRRGGGMKRALLLSLFELAGCTVGPDYQEARSCQPRASMRSLQQNGAPLSLPVARRRRTCRAGGSSSMMPNWKA